MKRYVRGYDSFREGDKVNEELIEKLIGFLKGLFKKAGEKIKKLKGDIEAFKKYGKDELLNPKSADSFFYGVFAEYNAKPQFNDQDCFDLISKMIDPDDSTLSQKSIQDLMATLGDKKMKKQTQFYLETVRNRALVFFGYGGAAAKSFVVGKPLPSPAIKPDLKSGKAVQRTADGKGFVDQTHLPALKKIIAPLADDKKKQAVIGWVNSVFIPQIYKIIDAITQEEVNKFLGAEGAVGYEVGDSVAYKRDAFEDGGQAKWDALTEDEKKDPNSDRFKELVKEGLIDVKKISKIEGEKVSFEGADFTKEIGDILVKMEGEAKESDAKMDYERLSEIYERGDEVIYLLPGADPTSYDANKKAEEQEDIVAVGKMKALNDQDTPESITFEKDGKDIKRGYADIVGIIGEKEKNAEAEEAAKKLGEIKDDPVKMKRVAGFADWLKDASDKDIEAMDDIINKR
jgi:hypothetical protein